MSTIVVLQHKEFLLGEITHKTGGHRQVDMLFLYLHVVVMTHKLLTL
jgi:hypothetical protein